MSLLLLLLLAISSTCRAALPPGYDEELYCPRGTCLRRKEQPLGWTGPRSSFHECFEPATGELQQPRAWGANLGSERREELRSTGHTQHICAVEPPPIPPPPPNELR